MFIFILNLFAVCLTVAVYSLADERDGLAKVSSSDCMNGGHSSDAVGREPVAAGSSPQLSAEPAESAVGPEHGCGPPVARRCSDTGTDPKGARQAGAVRRSMSEKGPHDTPGYSARCGR